MCTCRDCQSYTDPEELDRLDAMEQFRRTRLIHERVENEARHKEIVIALAQLEKKRLGMGYRFQNSHEHT